MIDYLNENIEGLLTEFEKYKFRGEKKEKYILFCFKLEPIVKSNKKKDFVQLSNGLLMLLSNSGLV